jgi:hypothetical protein
VASGIRNLFPDREAAVGRAPGKGIQCPELLPSLSHPPAGACSAACSRRSTACCWPTRRSPSATVTFPAAASDRPAKAARIERARFQTSRYGPDRRGHFFVPGPGQVSRRAADAQPSGCLRRIAHAMRANRSCRCRCAVPQSLPTGWLARAQTTLRQNRPCALEYNIPEF